MKEIRKLNADEIDVRIGATSKNGSTATLLLYKDARVDMALLDEVFGLGNWQDEYYEIKGVLYCKIGVRASATAQGNEQPLPNNEFVWKSSNGVESQGTGDDDPNNIKGEASDAFKRAGFMWGIGRELYNWKDLRISYDRDKDKYERYSVKEIDYEKGTSNPKTLIIVNKSGEVVYQFQNGAYKRPTTNPKQNASVDNQTKENVVTSEASNVKTQNNVEQETEEQKQAKVLELNKQIFGQIVQIVDEVARELKASDQEFDHAKKFGITNFFKDTYKLPLTNGKLSTLELDYATHTPRIKGNVVVAFDDEMKELLRHYLKNNEFLPI